MFPHSPPDTLSVKSPPSSFVHFHGSIYFSETYESLFPILFTFHPVWSPLSIHSSVKHLLELIVPFLKFVVGHSLSVGRVRDMSSRYPNEKSVNGDHRYLWKLTKDDTGFMFIHLFCGAEGSSSSLGMTWIERYGQESNVGMIRVHAESPREGSMNKSWTFNKGISSSSEVFQNTLGLV